jgi:uncharacterized ferritin-like protein (DUF455 family)
VTSVADAARRVLLTSDPRAKIFLARAVARDWRSGALGWTFDVAMPGEPARPERPERLSASRMPKRGRAGSPRARIAMLHALAHIEYGAIDLAFDMIGRFGEGAPRTFVDDWIGVGAEEALHFALLMRRLRTLDSGYGALPAHDGLWEAAEATAGDRLARLAVVPMILEARGLDVTPATVARFEAGGDYVSARILGRIYQDEIRHVAVGVRWFRHFCDQQRFDSSAHWQKLVRRHFKGSLKPPFNDSARNAAGLTMDFYSPLAAAR